MTNRLTAPFRFLGTSLTASPGVAFMTVPAGPTADRWSSPPNPGASRLARPGEGEVVAALYIDGRPAGTTYSLVETFAAMDCDPGSAPNVPTDPTTPADSPDPSTRPDRMAWIDIDRPSAAQIEALAQHFGLHELLVEDIIQAHQRPKLERYSDTLFVVLQPAHYIDSVEEVQFSEIHAVVGNDYIVTLRHSNSPTLAPVRARLAADSTLPTMGPEAILYAVFDHVVDGYTPVVQGIENDAEEIEYQVFSGDPDVSRRIYELSQEVADFQRAVRPLQSVLASLAAGFSKYGVDIALRAYLRDVADHLTEVREHVDGLRGALRDILTTNATLVTQRQNEEIRHLNEMGAAQNDGMLKVSAWAAILFAPSLVGGIYGMNFANMPELEWQYGYVFALGLMLAISITLWAVFKRKHWL
jgi:magnesium transporter